MARISRRELIQIAACTVAARNADAVASFLPPTHRVTSVEREVVAQRFRSLSFSAQEIRGILGERMDTNITGRLLRINESALVSGFSRRDNESSMWVGEHAGKFLDAACNALKYRENAELRALADRVAKALIAGQDTDGYLGTYPTDQRWTSWDVWVHKYNLIGLLHYFDLTGDQTALIVCRRMGDLLHRTFGDAPGKRDIIAAGDHMGMAATSVLEPICTLYRLTGEARYVEFAKYIVSAYDGPQGPALITSLLAHGSVYRTANAKAYEMLSNLNGLIDLYRLTADQKLLAAVLKAWNDIVQHQLYFTGTLSALEFFQPTGKLLSLRSSDIGETCATVTWLQLNLRLLRLTGEARFGQEIERTVYNHLLAAQDSRTGNISYYTSLVGPKEHTDEILCCVSSGPRGISLIPELVWGSDGDAIVIVLYTAGRALFQINGETVHVLSETDYPLSGDVALTISPARASSFTVRLRVPEWVSRFQAKVGSERYTGKAGQMLDITRIWQPSSSLQISMDMPVHPLPASSLYPGYVALKRGPQVLALEKAVNPTVSYLHRVGLKPEGVVVNKLAPPAGWGGRQVYAFEALVGVPASSDQLRLEQRQQSLVPFADALDCRVWMTRADQLRTDVPATTAFARAWLSVWNRHPEPADKRYSQTDITEFLTDENGETICTADPRNLSYTSYMHLPAGKRGEPVWFGVVLDVPTTISRVVFRHGSAHSDGGWFDTSKGKPYIEVARSGKPSFVGIQPDNWERVGTLDSYPAASSSTPPDLVNGQAFDVQLAQPVKVYGIRVVGTPAGEYASCAELSAYA